MSVWTVTFSDGRKVEEETRVAARFTAAMQAEDGDRVLIKPPGRKPQRYIVRGGILCHQGDA